MTLNHLVGRLRPRSSSPQSSFRFPILAFLLLAATASTWAITGNPNEITKIYSTNATQTSIDIYWNTVHPSTSQVIIARDTNYAPQRWAPVVADQNLVTSHHVHVDNLVPYNSDTGDGLYYYYVASVDVNGNLSTNPGPYDILHGKSPPWKHFKTLPTNTAGTLNYSFSVYGAQNVFAGSDLYLQVVNILAGGKLGSLTIINAGTNDGYHDAVIKDSNNNLDTTIQPHLACSDVNSTGSDADDQASGNPYNFCRTGNNAVRSQYIRLRTSANTPPGAYTATITLSPDGTLQNAYTYSYSFNVLPAAIFTETPPSSFPDIPGKATWETQMTALGGKWCDDLTNPSSRDSLNLRGEFLTGFGWQQDTWFYDGGRAFQQIDTYTANNNNANHARWQHCALTILDPYRQYLIAKNGSMQGYSIFPYGMAMNYWRTGDATNQQAVNLLATNNVWSNYVGAVDPYRVRETAYIADTWIAAELMGRPRDRLLARNIDHLIGIMDQMVNQKAEVHSFMVGLALEALINWYDMNQLENTPDYRIPLVVKSVLDVVWRDAWDANTSSLIYNRYDIPPAVGLTELNDLVAPAFAWYWSKTGDNTYLQEGDLLFQHEFDDMGQCNYMGKEFSQIYKWSFDYVGWRSGATSSTVAQVNNAYVGTYADTEPPIEYYVIARSISGTSASIAWRTYERSDTQVYYGTTTNYGNVTTRTDTGNGVIVHGATLTGLTPNTTYHFQARSVDLAGNLAAAADLTFKTAAQ